MVTKKRKCLKTKRKQRGGAGAPKDLSSSSSFTKISSGYEKFHPNNPNYVSSGSFGSLGSLGRRNSGISLSSVSSGSSISSDSSGSSVKNMLGIYGHQPPVQPRNLKLGNDTGYSSTNNNSGPLKISDELFGNFENSRERTTNFSKKTLRKKRNNLRTTYREPAYANNGRFLVKTVLKSGKDLDLQKLINLNKKSLSGLTENDYFNRLQELIKKDKNFINSVRELDNKREAKALENSKKEKQRIQNELQIQLDRYLGKQKPTNKTVEPATSLLNRRTKPNIYTQLLSDKEIAKRSSGNSGTSKNSGYLPFVFDSEEDL